MEVGTVKTLKVVRETSFGYFLSDGEEDILLHNSEIKEPVNIEDHVEVFIFHDHEGRKAATLTIPNVTMDTYDWVEVVEVIKHLGVFVSIGLRKDILVSLDDLPELNHLWPAVGDRLYCSLKTDKKGRLLGKIATDDTMRERSVAVTQKLDNQNIQGYVYRLLLEGSSVMTDKGYIGFIHRTERIREPRLGEKIEGRVIATKEDGTVNLSLLPRNYERLDDDAIHIYEYMQSRGGSMPYWDKSYPEEITKRFQMSKSAFKRALGKLMKENKITQKDGWTYINQDQNE